MPTEDSRDILRDIKRLCCTVLENLVFFGRAGRHDTYMMVIERKAEFEKLVDQQLSSRQFQ
ncbi:hypothetical protein ARMSODRAFT_947414, partial [Armillaria solidipes]